MTNTNDCSICADSGTAFGKPCNHIVNPNCRAAGGACSCLEADPACPHRDDVYVDATSDPVSALTRYVDTGPDGLMLASGDVNDGRTYYVKLSDVQALIASLGPARPKHIPHGSNDGKNITYGDPNSGLQGMLKAPAQGWCGATLVERLYNETPTAALCVEAGAKIQELRALLVRAERSQCQPIEPMTGSVVHKVSTEQKAKGN